MSSSPDLVSILILTIFRLNGRLIDSGDDLVAGLGLTTAWWQVLGALSVSPTPLPAAHVARNLGLSRPAVQRTADLLAEHGYVRFDANPHHQRAKLVVLTEKGIAAVRAAKRLQQLWAKEMIVDFSVDEIETALRVLNHMEQHLSAAKLPRSFHGVEAKSMTQGLKALAVGAAGQFAGLVVPELAKRGALVRAFVRHPSEENDVRAHGATEVAVGDLTDPTSVAAALNGIDCVFYIAPVFMHAEAEIGRQMVSAAKTAGVRRFVFSSVFLPGLSALENHRAKAPVEDAIATSGMEYTILQPACSFKTIERRGGPYCAPASWPSPIRPNRGSPESIIATSPKWRRSRRRATAFSMAPISFAPKAN